VTARTSDTPTVELPEREADPWVETRPGGLFFVNALLVAPVLMVLYPVLLRWLLGALTGFDGPSPILDPVPLVAAYVAPVVGWLALPAAGLVIWNLGTVDRRWARGLLWLFLATHVGVLVYTLGRWLA
jgi:hypothetical protein